jgi:hypothetical protein
MEPIKEGIWGNVEKNRSSNKKKGRRRTAISNSL